MGDLFFTAKDDVADIENDLIHELGKAVENSSHPFRFPTFISQGAKYPQARTMVLREMKGANKQLLFYTDQRSDKVAQIDENPQVAVHLYHPRKKLQLRLGGQGQIITEGEEWQRHFNDLPEQRYFEYSASVKPGNWIADAGDDYNFEPEAASENFALLVFTISEMEALQLNGRHHYRKLFTYRNQEWESQWLMP